MPIKIGTLTKEKKKEKKEKKKDNLYKLLNEAMAIAIGLNMKLT